MATPFMRKSFPDTGKCFSSISLNSQAQTISIAPVLPFMQGEGDTVTATVLSDRPGAVVIESIEGDNGRLSLEAEKNCVGIAALETLKLLDGQPSCGISLRLKKVE